MKIIAKTDSGYLVDATKNELALIMGIRSASDVKEASLRNGAEIEIREVDKVARFVRNLDSSKMLMIKKQLEIAIDDIDEAMDTVQQMTLFDTLENVE